MMDNGRNRGEEAESSGARRSPGQHSLSTELGEPRARATGVGTIPPNAGAENGLGSRLGFESLITRISTRFVNLEAGQLDEGIGEALEAVGRFSGVDRSYVFQLRADGTTIDNTHEWCAPGIEPQIAKLQALPLDEGFPWVAKRLRALETVNIRRVAELPSEARAERASFQEQDIQSLVLVPMVFEGRFIGFLGFDSVRRETTWSGEETSLLRMVGECFANALERRRAQRLLEIQRDIALALGSATDLKAALDELLEITSQIEAVDGGGVYLVDDRTGKLDLVSHYGLSPPFVQSVSSFGPESPHAAIVGAGKPVFSRVAEYTGPVRGRCEEEGIRALAVIPIQNKGRPIAAINLASRSHGRFPDGSRHALEAIAAQIGGLIVRLGAQAELRTSRNNLQTLFDTLDDMLFILDVNGRIVHVNPAVEKRMGYSKEELLRMNVFDVHPPEDRERAVAIIAKMLDGKASTCPIPLKTKSGSLIQVETKVNRGDWGGQPVLFGICRDISERKRNEQKIRRLNEDLERRVAERTSQLRFQAQLLDSVRESVIATDLEGRVVYWGRGAEALYGYTAEEVMGKPVTFLVKPQDEAEELDRLGQVRETGSWRGQYQQRRRDGTVFCADTLISLVKDENGQPCGMIGIDRDITKRRQTESLLRIQRDLGIALASTSHLEAAAQCLLEACTQIQEVEACSLYSADERTGQAVLISHVGPPGGAEAVASKLSLDAPQIQAARAGTSVYPGPGEWQAEAGRGDLTFGPSAILPVQYFGRLIALLVVRMNNHRGLSQATRTGLEAIATGIGGVFSRIRAETALQESERKYRDLAELLPQPVFEAERDGTLVYANRAAFATFRYEEDDLAKGGVNVLDMVAWEFLDKAKRNIGRVLQGEQLAGNEYTLLRKDGTAFEGVIFTNPVVREDRMAGIRGIIVDVSGIKETEAALRRERDFAERLIEAAPTIVLVLDTAGRVVRCNPHVATLTGYPLQEIVGEDWFAKFLPNSERLEVRAFFEEMVSGRDVTTRTNSIVTRDGQRREIEWRNRTLKADDGTTTGVLAIGHDVTELREAQRQALQAERLAAIGQMVAGLAHESGNALQRTQSCLEMLALKLQDRPSALDLLDRMQIAQDRLQNLYKDVRQYAAPMVLARASARLRDIVQQAWANLEPIRSGRHARLGGCCLLTEDVCHVDPDALERVFQNLFENSLAACPDRVEITVARSDTLLDGQPAVEVAVRDNGTGLNGEQRKRIFEPFFTTKTRGTGLGMAISRRIVEAHGGRIQVGRDCARGAEIVITLPKGVDDDTAQDCHRGR
jgi:PAS domain S-box-containing protein